jgi:tetratricopeptide (TPR) repeat protein
VTRGFEAAVEAVYAARDRDHMLPTIAAFEALSAAHPDEAELVYEVAGGYDTAGEEARAAPLYERALAMGLEGDVLRRCLIQYGSTLRNLERFDESLAVLERADREFPGSSTAAVFRALTLHESGRSDAAVGTLLRLIAAAPPGDLGRYVAATRGNADFLLDRDRRSAPAGPLSDT